MRPAPAFQPTSGAAGGTSPDAYTRWRTTTLGRVTEALEQRRILDLVGPLKGQRVLDLGSGDGLLTAALATQAALAVGIDIDRSMLLAAMARTEHRQPPSARFVRGRLEQLPFRDATFDVVVAVTVLCLVSDQTFAVREAARVLRPGGRMVIGDLGRWSAWAARRRIKGWCGSRLWRSAHFSSAADLTRLLERAGLTVEAVRGSVYYPPLGLLAQPLARLDHWFGSLTTVGAAFIAMAATKNDPGSTIVRAYGANASSTLPGTPPLRE